MYLLTSEDCCAVGGAEFENMADGLIMVGAVMVAGIGSGLVVGGGLYALGIEEEVGVVLASIVFIGVTTGLCFLATPEMSDDLKQGRW